MMRCAKNSVASDAQKYADTDVDNVMGENDMERLTGLTGLTEYCCGVEAIKDKGKLTEPMRKAKIDMERGIKFTNMTDSCIIPKIYDAGERIRREENNLIVERLVALGIDKDILQKQTFEILRLNNILKEYEDLEEQGLLIRLPCKVGDIIYFAASEVVRCKVRSFEFNDEHKLVIQVVYAGENESMKYWSTRFLASEIGIIAFLTKAEAEEALKKMEKEHES